MKIKPVGSNVLIKVDEVKVAGLDTSAVKSAVEIGIVKAIGPDVKTVKVGDRINFKAWAADLSEVDGKGVRYVDEKTLGIKAILE